MRICRILFLFLLIAGGSLRAQYVVESGDTLSGIAKKTLGDGNRWMEIARLNQLATPYRLQVGQRLQLPLESTVDNPVDVRTERPPSPIAPVAVKAQSEADKGTLKEDLEVEMVSKALSEMIGRDIVLPEWMISIRAVFFLFVTIILLIYVPFWATGVMFTMFLFRIELNRWNAIKTAVSWGAILLGALLPLSFIGMEQGALEKFLPWIAGLGLVALLLAVRAAKRFTGCSTLQSPFVCLFGFVFGCAAFETLIYVVFLVLAVVVGTVIGIAGS